AFTSATLNYLIAADSEVTLEAPNTDGSRTKMSWAHSPSDPSRWDVTVEHFNLWGDRTGWTLIRPDGTREAHALDPEMVETWKERIQRYDANGELVSDETLNRDGTSSVTEWDYTGTTEWSQRIVTYDAADPRQTVK